MKCNEKIGRNGVSSYLCIVRTRHVEPFKQKKENEKDVFPDGNVRHDDFNCSGTEE